jgi:hypothetical protein
LGGAPGQGNNIYGNGYGVFSSVPHVTCIAAAYNYWGAAGGPDDVSDGVWYGAPLDSPNVVTAFGFAVSSMLYVLSGCYLRGLVSRLFHAGYWDLAPTPKTEHEACADAIGKPDQEGGDDSAFQ